MGYLNPVMHFGVEKFCAECKKAGVDGVILPDLPMEEYEASYKKVFEENGLRFIFLISPQTSEARIHKIDSLSNGFIYMVSSSATTGATGSLSEAQLAYFNKVKSLKLKNPLVVGFGISNRENYLEVCKYANGAIIGSAFVRMLEKPGDWTVNTREFIKSIQ